MPIANSFNCGKPAWTAQADKGQYFSQFPYGLFLHDESHMYVGFLLLLSGFALSIAIVAKCDKKIIVAQDFFIWRKCMATTFCQVT